MEPVYTFTFIPSPDKKEEGKSKILIDRFFCPLSGREITVLVEQHQRDSLTPTLSYLMARVKDVTGKITFYDGYALQKELLQSGVFQDPITEKWCKSITYYKTMDSGNDKSFQQIYRCKTFQDLQDIDYVIKCYDPKEMRVRYNVISRGLKENEEVMSWLNLSVELCLNPPMMNTEWIEVTVLLGKLFFNGCKALPKDLAVSKKLFERLLAFDNSHAEALGYKAKIDEQEELFLASKFGSVRFLTSPTALMPGIKIL